MTGHVFLAYLAIFAPVFAIALAGGLFLGWVLWGGRVRGHKRRCPTRQPVSDSEWDGITARIRDAGGSG
jgi:uncharacterized iron-regulated membrane protein